MCDLAPVALADRHRVDEFSALGIILVRVVIRKKDAIGAHGKDRAVKRLGVEVAARGDPNVLREIVSQALLRKAAIRTEVDAVLNAPGEKRQGLAEMSQHQLGSRKAIKDAAIDDAQRMRRGLRGKTPVRAGKLRMVVVHGSVVRRAWG